MNSLEPKLDDSPRRKEKRFWLLVLLLSLCGVGVAIYCHSISQPAMDDLPSPLPDAELDSTSHAASWFHNSTEGSGIQFSYRNGEEANQFTILEALGGGVGLIDYDRDGLLDIFVAGGGHFGGQGDKDILGYPCKLYRNLGNCKFQDVTRDVGLDIPWWYTHGTAVADYDRDGWPDLLVTGYGKLALFHNEDDGKGGRLFRDATKDLGLKDDSWSTGAGWADIDGDGYPDLYVCHYVDWTLNNNPTCKGSSLSVQRDVCNPENFKPLVHALFHNEKGKNFRNMSSEFGFRATGCGLGVVCVDLNNDGMPDIYVANDTPYNFLFMNRHGKLEEKGFLAGVAADEIGRPQGSMGVDAGAYDGSDRPALWVTNFQAQFHALFRNQGHEVFYHQSRAAGTAAIGQEFVGFGTGFIDVDNDGWEDLIIANGHVWRFPASGSAKQKPILLHNVELNSRRFFKDASSRGGVFFQNPAIGRGLAIGNLDNDGWPDVVVSHSNSPIVLLRNQAKDTQSSRWLGLKLVGRKNRDVVGSTVVLQSDRRKLTRFAKGGGSYLSANDQRILIGLGESEQVQSVTVQWSWGQSQTWDRLEVGNYWELHEGQAVAKHITR